MRTVVAAATASSLEIWMGVGVLEDGRTHNDKGERVRSGLVLSGRRAAAGLRLMVNNRPQLLMSAVVVGGLRQAVNQQQKKKEANGGKRSVLALAMNRSGMRRGVSSSQQKLPAKSPINPQQERGWGALEDEYFRGESELRGGGLDEDYGFWGEGGDDYFTGIDEDPRLPSDAQEQLTRKGWVNGLIAAAFVIGIGAGITVDSVLNADAKSVASREVIDRQTPNPDICLANGMSAMVLDQRLFISFNPFNVYVTQAEVKPGCVLRQSNWSVLESRGLISSKEAQNCKKNMNTFGFVGDLRQAPEISCVYHSESAENLFLKDPAKAALGDGFQPRDFNDN